MFKPALLLLVLAIAPFAVLAIDPPACPDGQGLIDTSKPTYTRNPDPKNCKDCAVSGCIYCLDDYRKCEICEAGKGLSGETKCVKCSQKDCGVCNDNYKKCEAKICYCPDQAVKNAATASTQGKYEAGQSGYFDYCQGEPGFSGNGRSSYYNAAVVDGTCIDCNGDFFRPYSEGGTSFCVFNKIGRDVAAMAFKKKSGCAYPGSVKLTLKKTCLTQSGILPYFINIVYSAKYCGETKTVIASGGGKYNDKGKAIPDDASKWQYIIKP